MTEPIPPDPDPDKLALLCPQIATRVLTEETYSVTNRAIQFAIDTTPEMTNLERDAARQMVRDLVNSAIITVSWPAV
jgi:hypothetical protein